MRGPGLRASVDVRRTWRCPVCGYERRADGRLTSIRCQCAGSPFMQLADEPRFRRLQNRPVNTYVNADDLLGPPDPAPQAPPSTDSAPVSPAAESIAAEPISTSFAEVTAATTDEAGQGGAVSIEVSVLETPTEADGAAGTQAVSGTPQPIDTDAASSEETAPAEGTAPPTGESRPGRRRHRNRRPRGPRPASGPGGNEPRS